MCGISGLSFASKSPLKDYTDSVRAMGQALRHRGPDGYSLVQSEDGMTLVGHNALKIEAIGDNPQPAEIVVEGRQYLLSFNGEIYNYKHLRSELELLGFAFRTQGDAEVLLCSYVAWGNDCVKRLDGEYAFAIYNASAREVFLARDRMGVKPLFYFADERLIIFASEPKAILASGIVRAKPDNITIADYFLQKDILPNAVSRPGRSFFEGIRSVQPASYIVWSKGSFKETEYWRPQFSSDRSVGQNDYTRIREALFASVRRRIPSEVEYGCLVSGGLDSSLVAAICSSADSEFACYTTHHLQGENSDYYYARMLCEHLEKPLKSTTMAADRLIELVDDLVYALDEPHNTTRQLSLLSLYQDISNDGRKVALLGEGADEISLGYYFLYPFFKIDNLLGGTPKRFQLAALNRAKFVNNALSPEFVSKTSWEDLVLDDCKDFLEDCDSSRFIDMAQNYYIRRFLHYRLTVNDRCAMAHGVENRVPFCDRMCVDSLLSVDPHSQISQGLEKQVLRKSFAGFLPAHFLYRPKFPFPEPISRSMHLAVLVALNDEIRRASESVWSVLNRDWLNEFMLLVARSVEQGRSFSFNGYEVTATSDPVGLTGSPSFTMNHAFLCLTFLRWWNRWFD